MRHIFVTVVSVVVVWLAAIGMNTSLLAQVSSEQQEKPVSVLIVTGVDYPGHPWRTQAIELRKAFGESKRIDVRLVEDIEVLGTDLIFDYDVLMLNFKNYDPLKREDAAKKNLVKFVNDGKGLMFFHFTAGAFQEWPEYEKIAGRIWNPSFRGHDPYQQFTVNVAKKDHPVMQGINDFHITDELYTCLDGAREIEVVAEAKSAVDDKVYPMAFVFTQGKGRVFHTVLGHDQKAFESPELGQMLRNAALWCVGREVTH
ncbi:MAG: ThuA domain-containing protein [Thermoguttaceae bacterium]